jgi:hypothetical protein
MPAEVLPPTTDVGFSARPVKVGAVTPRGAVWDAPFSVALIVAVRSAAIAVVEIAKVPAVWPAAMVTVAGTVTPVAVLSLESAIVRPPIGAALEIVTVPCDETPPTTDVGFRDSAVKVGAATTSVAV